MARIALISELGVGHDHLRRLAWLARVLRTRGHDPVFVVNDTVKADAVVGDQGFPVLPTPAWRAPVAGLPQARTYTDLLLRHGFVDAAGLRGLVRAWRHLLRVLDPALLVFDHAPVAMFATHRGGRPRLRCGDGFGCPPLATPMPLFQWWAPSEDAFDQIAERTVVHMANQVAAELGEAPVAAVADFLAADAEALCTAAELDPYGLRDEPVCVGPVVPPAPATGPGLPWPDGSGPLAYVQLRADYALLEPLLAALRRQGWRVVAHLSGLSSARARALADDRLLFAPEPPPVHEVAEHCQAAISHGGYGSAHALAQAGRPQLLLPQQVSQAMLARRLQALGAGVAVDAGGAEIDVAAWLDRLRDDAGMAASAAALAARLSRRDAGAAVDAIVQRCEALL
ncbi:MAG: hypothetical protein U1F56_14285 [Rubrivivax sp.]